MICDCEVYEICPSCAPSEAAYANAAAAHDEVVRSTVPSSPSYTLKEVSELAQVYTNEIVVPTVTDRRILQLQLGRFLTWLAKREREGLDGER